MKRFSTVLIFLLFINYFFSPFLCIAQHERDGVTDVPYMGDKPDNGDNTLGQIYNNTQCGLNYIISSQMITQRFWASLCISYDNAELCRHERTEYSQSLYMVGGEL
jgi:hypothetical protein